MMRRRAMYDTVPGQRTADGPAAPFDLPPAPEWMRDALCAQTGDPDAFFPGKTNEGLREARAICALCPVRTECLQYSLDIDARFGVFGGLTEAQRSRLRKGGAA